MNSRPFEARAPLEPDSPGDAYPDFDIGAGGHSIGDAPRRHTAGWLLGAAVLCMLVGIGAAVLPAG